MSCCKKSRRHEQNKALKMLKTEMTDEPGSKTCGSETPGNGEEHCSGLCPCHVL